MTVNQPAITADRFDAVLFDLDGVLTDTARIHARAWKTMFDEFLKGWASEKGVPFVPFDVESDYLLHVDGKPVGSVAVEGMNICAETGVELPCSTRLLFGGGGAALQAVDELRCYRKAE